MINSMGKSKTVLAVAGLVAIIAVWFFGSTGESDFGGEIAQIFARKPVKKECVPAPYQRQFSSEPYYVGPLVDAHVHMPVSSRIVAAVAKRLGNVEFNLSLFDRTLTTDQFVCLFQGGGIRQLFGFFLTTKFSLGAEVRTMKKFQKENIILSQLNHLL